MRVEVIVEWEGASCAWRGRWRREETALEGVVRLIAGFTKVGDNEVVAFLYMLMIENSSVVGSEGRRRAGVVEKREESEKTRAVRATTVSRALLIKCLVVPILLSRLTPNLQASTTSIAHLVFERRYRQECMKPVQEWTRTQNGNMTTTELDCNDTNDALNHDVLEDGTGV